MMDILLTTLFNQDYSKTVPAKSGTGISSPKSLTEPTSRMLRIAAFFVGLARARLSVLAGWVGQPSGWPVSVGAGTANPVQSASHPRLAALGSGYTTKPTE